MSKTDPLFRASQHALEQDKQTCPNCGHTLEIKSGKNGSFVGCSNYPECDFTRPLHPETTHFEGQIIPNSACPECSKPLAVKHGRYGMFIGCSAYPECHHIEHQHEAKQFVAITCPQCDKGVLHQRSSRYGKVFYACDQYPKCKFVVNHEPITGSCSKCQFPLLIKRKLSAGEKLQCGDKKCAHFQEINE